MISWNLEDSSIDLDNARSSDRDYNYTYDSGTFKTVLLLNAVCENLKEKRLF
jgi:hypothetical protein